MATILVLASKFKIDSYGLIDEFHKDNSVTTTSWKQMRMVVKTYQPKVSKLGVLDVPISPFYSEFHGFPTQSILYITCQPVNDNIQECIINPSILQF